MMRCTRRKSRRGVLILVVLSLLALFIVVAVAFVLTAGQHHTNARFGSTAGQYGNDPNAELDAAMLQLLRGTRNPKSSIVGGHDLLADLYGYDGFRGTINGAAGTTDTAQQFIDLQIGSVAGDTLGNPIASSPYPLNSTPGYYNGCVLTILTGRGRGLSTRIVADSGGASSSRVLTIVALRNAWGNRIVPNDLGQQTFLVNGRPFNGTGAGYNATTGRNDLTETVWVNTGNRTLEAALLPHRSEVVTQPKLAPYFPDPTLYSDSGAYLLGGPDESYDAPDFQNMFLAYMPPNPSETDPARRPIPSFVRPNLLRYWNNIGNFHPDLRRRISMRPTTKPGSAGSAPGDNVRFPEHTTDNFETADELADGPYDVDNDGDGVRDSIWIDLGFPVQIGADGAWYKPMFAFLCVDLDGRVNLNAQGSAWHYTSVGASGVMLPQAISLDARPQGQGYGPPDVNLAIADSTKQLLSPAEYQKLLEGDSGNGVLGRYGSSQVPGATLIDVLAKAKFCGCPINYFAYIGSAYNSPPDMHGRLRMGIDYQGMPFYSRPTTPEKQSLPYQIDLSPDAARGAYPGTADAPFSPAELEVLLRIYDVDVSTLPDRLVRLAPSLADHRNEVTTESYDVPAPAIMGTLAQRQTLGANLPRHLIDILAARLTAGGYTGSIPNAIAAMLPPEVIRGQRMDVNRPFGNGMDDNNNGFVDEPLETANETAWGDNSIAPPGFASIPFDHTNGDPLITNRRYARQIYARHLFILMMLLKDVGSDVLIDGSGPTNEEETARAIAQWAVNVADFRDSDAVMSAFEYDYRPFDANGWQAMDGDLTTNENNTNSPTDPDDRRYVWGCERPEVLITEAIAWHDRATEDRDDDASGDGYTANPPPGKTAGNDPDYDQRLRPRGRLFIELYNPWAATDQYDFSSGQWHQWVDLTQTSAAGSPVWRILVVGGASKGLDPDDPDPSNQPVNTDIERSIYFTAPTAIGATGHGQPYYPSNNIQSNLAVLKPGRYAVVGSSGALDNGNYVSTIGRRKDANDGAAINTTRRVVLSPNNNPDANQFQVFNADGGSAAADAPTVPDIQPVIAIPIDTPRSLSISEPTAGYDATGWSSTGAGGEGAYAPPLASPLDKNRADLDADDQDALMTNGTTRDYRRVHLQRLADPTLPWNSFTNPYLTIDSASVDLTAFNGVSDDAKDPDVDTDTTEFSTHERGRDVYGKPSQAGGGTLTHMVWRYEPPITQALVATQQETAGADSHYFPYLLRHSLGRLNTPYLPAYTNTTAPMQVYVGAPQAGGSTLPVPNLAWHNRPFVNEMEMMLVPPLRSSQLLREFPEKDSDMPSTGAEPYVAGASAPSSYGNFLLNFFDTQNAGLNLYRLFEYTCVPSRFIHTETELNPNTFYQGQGGGTVGFHAPFNHVSNMREPGKININTISSERVWLAVLNGHPGPRWEWLVASRRGYGSATDPTQQLGNLNYPTYFANPFRAFSAADLVPLSSAPSDMTQRGIDVTLLRRKPAGATGPAANVPSSVPQPVANEPLFYASLPNGSDAIDPKRHAYFRYQNAQRVENLLTTRSNVFAVWVTVGYFNIAVRAPRPGTLQTEVGSDRDGGRRHRAFYIIDRSIPVGFEPGRDHNVENAVILRRYLD